MTTIEDAHSKLGGSRFRSSSQPKIHTPKAEIVDQPSPAESGHIGATPVGPAVRTELPLQLLKVEQPPISATSNNPALKECVAACILGLSDETLKKWRQRGIGPNYVQYGPDGAVRYLLSNLMEFRANHRIKTRHMPKIIEVREAPKAKHRKGS